MRNWTAILLFTFFALSGCGEMREGQRARGISSIGLGLTAPSSLQGDEASVAYAVCSALRTKDSKYRIDHLNQGFFWQLKHKSCSSSQAITEINSYLRASNSSSPLYFESSFSGFYFKEVETHNRGLFADICDPILKGQSVSDTIDKGTQRVQYRFYVDGAKVKASVLQALQDINDNSSTHGQFLTQKEDVFTINTSSQSSASMTGLVEERVRTIPCPGGGVESITQLFLHHSGYTN